MKKNTKKILAFSVLGLFMLMFAMQFVAADRASDLAKAEAERIENEQVYDNWKFNIKDNPIGGWFRDWETGENFSANIAKYLFWALISIVIFAIAKNIPGIGSQKDGIKWAFAILIGFLTMAYITPDEVYNLMTGYTALGLILGGAMPLVILLYFTITMAGETYKKNATEILTTRIMAFGLWIAFTGFLIIKLIQTPENIDGTAIQWIMIVLSAAVTIGMTAIFKFMRVQMHDASVEKYETDEEKRRLVARQEINKFNAETS